MKNTTNTELRTFKSNLKDQKEKYIEQFNNKINKLISETPTGDLRNELTELNILHNSIIEITLTIII